MSFQRVYAPKNWNRQNLELTLGLSNWWVRKQCSSAAANLRSKLRLPIPEPTLCPRHSLPLRCCLPTSLHTHRAPRSLLEAFNFFSTSLSLFLDKSYLCLLHREAGPVKHDLDRNYYCNNEFFYILEGKKNVPFCEEKENFVSAPLQVLRGCSGASFGHPCLRVCIWLGETFDLTICFFPMMVPTA